MSANYDDNKTFEPWTAGSISIAWREGRCEGHIWRYGEILLTITGQNQSHVLNKLHNIRLALSNDYHRRNDKVSEAA